MDNQQAQRLKALWKSGRDKYASFFSVLEDVRAEIGDTSLPRWCVDELRIGLSVITSVRGILLKTDQEIVQRNLAEANKVAKERRKAAVADERKARAAAAEKDRKEREEAAHQRELERLARAKVIAEKKLETVRAQTEVKKTQDAEKARQQKRKNPNERGSQASTKRAKRALVANISDAELADLTKRFEAAERMCADGETQWIEGSIVKALTFAAARVKLPADQDFGDWVERFPSARKPLKNERAALIGLGRFGDARLREILTSTESHSYELIWREHKPKPALAVVEN